MMWDKKYAKRLLKLADHLDTVPRKLFDFAIIADDRKCGTVACAIGHAGTMSCFRRLGFKTVPSDVDGLEFVGPRGLMDFEAAATLFGLEYEEVLKLFQPGTHPYYSGLPDTATPKQVAKHIRKFVKRKLENESGAAA